MLHRNLEPANIMLGARGNVRMTDFGLAVLAGEPEQLNAGTPGLYVSGTIGGQGGHRAERYLRASLVLHELFTGKRAMDARTPTQRLRERSNLTVAMPGIHPLIQQIVARCLDPNPAKRPASVIHVAAVMSRAARLGCGRYASPCGTAAAIPSGPSHDPGGLVVAG